MAAATGGAFSYSAGQDSNPYEAWQGQGGHHAYQWNGHGQVQQWPQQGAAAPSGKSDEATGFVVEAGAPADQGTASQSHGQYGGGDLAALWAEYHRQQAAYQETYQQPHAQQWPQQPQQHPWGQPGPHAAPWQGDNVVPAQAPLQALAADGGPPLEKIPDPAGYGLWEETIDASSNKRYWVNHQLERTQWDRPVPATPVAEPAQAPIPAIANAPWNVGSGPSVNQRQYGAPQQYEHYGMPQQQHGAPQQHNPYGPGGQYVGHHYQQQQQQQQISQPAKNSFSWTARVKTSPVQSTEFKWQDGRDHEHPAPPAPRDTRDIREHTKANGWGSRPVGQDSPHVQPSTHSAATKRGDSSQSQPVSGAWPPKLQKYVERSFEQCMTNHARAAMQDKLKTLIESVKKQNRLWATDWDAEPLIPLSPENSQPGTPRHQRHHRGKQKKRQRDNDRSDDKDDNHEVKSAVDKEAREARDRRNKRFIDLQQGVVSSGGQGVAEGEEIKFISSEAVVGTCMVMEKMFIRLQSMPDPTTVRPEKVLVKWAERLQVKYDTDEADYEWIADQFKAVRQDMVIQHIRNDNTIKIYEANARIALLEDDMGEFYKIQSFLVNLYKEMPEISTKNMNEFIAYRIFYWIINNNNADLMKEMKHMTKAQKQDTDIKHALQLHAAVELSDYDSFFSLYSSTRHLGKCLAKHLKSRMRSKALRVILRAYKPTISVDVMMVKLGFKSSFDGLLGDNNDDDDDDDWGSFADEAKLVPSDASGDLIDTKASYDALSNADRGPPCPPNRK